MKEFNSLLLTFSAGIFFLLGGLISLKIKNKEKLNCFSIGLAFIIIINLLLRDLFPEIIEQLEMYSILEKILIISIFTLLGIGILKILDAFIPDHHHQHKDNETNKKEHFNHLKHIGTLTLISLILHNLLEGFAIAGVSLNNFKAGSMMCLSVALHNIPLGTTIFSSLDLKKNKLLIGLLTISSLIGGLTFILIGHISPLILSIISAITLGMLIYIALFELLPEIIVHLKKKETILGMLTGLMVIIMTLVI